MKELMKQHMVSKPQIVEDRINELEKIQFELNTVKAIISGALFQKYFAEKIYKENKKLKHAYDCKTVAEINFLRGKHWGLNQFFKCVDEVENQLAIVNNDLKVLKN